MKKKLLFVLSLVLSFATAFSQGKSIEEVQCLPKLSQTTFVTLLSDNTVWWSANGSGWQKVPATGLPANSKIRMINVYTKPSLGNKSSRLVVLLEDNTMWWYTDGDPWEKLSSTGLPKNAVMKILQPYVKYGAMGFGDTRFVALLEDNTMWWYAVNKEWETVPSEGLPSKYVVTGFGTYQKSAMMGTDTRYVITLADNSLWWTDGKKWKALESSGLPAGAVFKKFTAYMKVGALNIEGRLIAVLSDESIWWLPSSGKNWKKLDVAGLPKDYKVKSVEIYQKHAGMLGETRLILLMEDNTIWWWADSKGWSNLDTKELTK